MHLRPPRGFDTNGELTLTPRQYIDEAFVVDGFLDALAELQTEINARETKNGEKPAEYPKIVMLGTGSCIPNKTRNTSGILLRVDEETSIVFDCGEATAGQLVRFYGSKEVDKVLSTIKVIIKFNPDCSMLCYHLCNLIDGESPCLHCKLQLHARLCRNYNRMLIIA